MKIIIITPTRNEGDYIKATLDSMAMQTVSPYKWIIVDDGSTDNTKDIIKEYINKCKFIKYVNLEDRGYREPATGVINAFYQGYNLIKNEDYDVISKFDADLKFPSDFLKKIVNAFKTDEKLGITGGQDMTMILNLMIILRLLYRRILLVDPQNFIEKNVFLILMV